VTRGLSLSLSLSGSITALLRYYGSIKALLREARQTGDERESDRDSGLSLREKVDRREAAAREAAARAEASSAAMAERAALQGDHTLVALLHEWSRSCSLARSCWSRSCSLSRDLSVSLRALSRSRSLTLSLSAALCVSSLML
jgi:hypothetical protein